MRLFLPPAFLLWNMAMQLLRTAAIPEPHHLSSFKDLEDYPSWLDEESPRKWEENDNSDELFHHPVLKSGSFAGLFILTADLNDANTRGCYKNQAQWAYNAIFSARDYAFASFPIGEVNMCNHPEVLPILLGRKPDKGPCTEHSLLPMIKGLSYIGNCVDLVVLRISTSRLQDLPDKCIVFDCENKSGHTGIRVHSDHSDHDGVPYASAHRLSLSNGKELTHITLRAPFFDPVDSKQEVRVFASGLQAAISGEKNNIPTVILKDPGAGVLAVLLGLDGHLEGTKSKDFRPDLPWLLNPDNGYDNSWKLAMYAYASYWLDSLGLRPAGNTLE